MVLPWFLCGVLTTVVLALLVKIRRLHTSLDEIGTQLGERLSQDTNTLISLSSGDRHARRLAAELNRQLRLLRRQRRQYLQGDRELKEAVTNISHDLRTPLTAICGYLELLEREDKSEAAARYLATIGDRAQALRQLTEELLRYAVILSTREDLPLDEVRLNGALEESVAAFYAALTARGITPDIRITEKPIIRRLNRAALSRVFSNLLNNALAYSDGDLEVALTDGGEAVFTNTAAGLDDLQVGRLFDRFFSVEAARNSTGLGLAISRTLVEQMNGTIRAWYADGKLHIAVAFPDGAKGTA